MCQVAPICDSSGKVVAQKLRFKNKKFKLVGDTKTEALFGMHLCRDGGKMLIITEGEIDAMSVAQTQGLKWPAVSVTKGATGAAKQIRANSDKLEKFDRVVFMFDMDEPGQAAAIECAELLPPGKSFIASLPLKDASDMLQAGRGAEITSAAWGAREYRPDGIVNASDLRDIALDFPEMGILYPYQGLNDKTMGLRKGELVTFCAGSGIGKSSVCREIAYFLLARGHRVGYIALEENVQRTLHGLMGIHMDLPLHLGRGLATDEEILSAYEKVTEGRRLSLYDHFGSLQSDNLLSKIRYLAVADQCSFIFLDHLSIVVSGDTSIDNERRAIDITMTKLRSLVEETGVGIILVSHLKRPEGKGHEDGAQTSLSQLRGSAAIAQLSDIVLGLERDQQDQDNKDLTTLRVLKNRFTGDTGIACSLKYTRSTGRLHESDENILTHAFKDEDDNDF